MQTNDWLRNTAARTESIARACQKILEGINELRGTLDGAEPAQIPAVDAPDLSVLTKRHREIFDLIGNDLPAADIAKRLSLKPRTVDSHRDTIRRRLGFRTAAQLEEFAKTYRKGR